MAGTTLPPTPPGAHFLRSSYAAEFVRRAGLRPGDTVVDLGAGGGALTRELLRTGARVLAVERDPRLAAGLRSSCPSARVIETDLRRWRPPCGPYRVVANPPFALVAHVFAVLLDGDRPVRAADLVLPLWAAHRLRAGGDSRRWRRRAARYDVRLGRRLPPTAFTPPSVPAVEVAIRRR